MWMIKKRRRMKQDDFGEFHFTVNLDGKRRRTVDTCMHMPIRLLCPTRLHTFIYILQYTIHHDRMLLNDTNEYSATSRTLIN